MATRYRVSVIVEQYDDTGFSRGWSEVARERLTLVDDPDEALVYLRELKAMDSEAQKLNAQISVEPS